MLRSIAVVACSVVALAASSPVDPADGAIRGRVDVQLPPPLVDHHADVSDLGITRRRPAPDRRRAVVYLETAPRAAFEEPRVRRARMDQRNETFIPHILAITVGTTVDFPNNDRTYHNVFSLSRTRQFDLGRYAAGGSKAVTFDRPGIVRVFCDIHSHMSAYILVFSHRFFAVTGTDGTYRIDDVPAGTYMVSVWNEATEGESRAVTVPAGGDIEVDFALARGGP